MSLSRAAQVLAQKRARERSRFEEMPTLRYRRQSDATAVIAAVCFAFLGLAGLLAAVLR